MDVSCWTFIRMAHLAEPLMHKGGTLFTMSYYGSQMVVKNYNIMGVAKAALEYAVRYLAAELRPKGIRAHAISLGPLATRAASGIPEFDALLDKAKAPARSLVSIDDVGAATVFLRNDAARLITGETLYVDGGYHIIDWRLPGQKACCVQPRGRVLISPGHTGRTRMPTFTWDHIHLRTPDPEGTAQWFERMFGAEVIRSMQQGKPRIDIKLGGAMIFTAQVNPGDGVKPAPTTPYQGLDHFGLAVSGIDAIAADLKKKGVEFTQEPHSPRPGIKICFLRGPQGISIELLDRDPKYA